MNKRYSICVEDGRATLIKARNPLSQWPRLLIRSVGSCFERAQLLFSLLKLPVMLMISSGRMRWSISDVVEGLVITKMAVEHHRQQRSGSVILYIIHADNMTRWCCCNVKHVTQRDKVLSSMSRCCSWAQPGRTLTQSQRSVFSFFFGLIFNQMSDLPKKSLPFYFCHLILHLRHVKLTDA